MQISLKDQINTSTLPKHIAIIMDGNGRWAKGKGRPRVFGHKNGVKAVREVNEACAEIGVEYLTLYAFSTENWKRPRSEVSALMTLLIDTIKRELKTLTKNNIRLKAIGDLSMLPKSTQQSLYDAIEETRNNTRMTLILALNYSGRWDIENATKQIAIKVRDGILDANELDGDTFKQHLVTCDYPDPELMIRTSGESRLSNYLMYQMAYTELYFTETLWPDFNREHLYQAILNFQQRERRFGDINPKS